MGNTASGFTDVELKEYEELTFLTKKEILQAWKKWKELVGESEEFEDKTKCFPIHVVQKLAELQYNPFMDQIARQFGHRSPPHRRVEVPPPSADEADDILPVSGYEMNFESFLDLLNVMSPRAPLQLKAHYAFKMFDFDHDTLLNRADLQEVIVRLTGNKLEHVTRDLLIAKLLDETDVEGDEAISEEEFKHLLTKCPDFRLSFCFTL